MYLDLENVDVIQINIQNKQYYISSCSYYRSWKNFNNLPEAVQREWVFIKTKRALTILCNGEEVVNLVYAEVSDYCTSRWSRKVTKIRFYNHDTASDYWKPVTQGKEFMIEFLLLKELIILKCIIIHQDRLKCCHIDIRPISHVR